MAALTLEQRLLSKTIEDSGVKSPFVDTPCWTCRYSPTNGGYPQMSVSGFNRKASIVAQWLWGDPPTREKPCVLHICDNVSCINPQHLKLGTQVENLADMKVKGRQAKGENHSEIMKIVAARGDSNGSRTCPESRSNGKKHSEIMKRVAARGENSGSARLTEQDVRIIRSYKKRGYKLTYVANFMKLPLTTVSNVWQGYYWKHVV